MRIVKITTIIATVAMLQGCIAAAVIGAASSAFVVADTRTVGTQIDDQRIELDAYTKLSKHQGLQENANLQVTSINGAILVVGQATNTYLRDEAINIIKAIKGVKQIHNQIRIGDKVTLSTKSNDLWLTSKIKTALFKNDMVDATNIKVVTENAEVFLMGLITQKNADNAVDVARNISGVNRVIKVFEYQ